MPLRSKKISERAPQISRDRWRTGAVDPKALFIWETKNHRIVVGRALAAAIVVLLGGAPVLKVASFWIPVAIRWLEKF